MSNKPKAPPVYEAGVVVAIDPKYGVQIAPTSCGGMQDLRPVLPMLRQLFEAMEVRLVKHDGHGNALEAVPEDEPVMIFRGRDRLALDMLRRYRELAVADGCTAFHLAGIDNRIDAFARFRKSHPDRMKQPGITEGR